MDLSGVKDLLTLCAFLAVCVVGIVQVRQQRAAKGDTPETPRLGGAPASNGHGVSANYMRAFVAENCRDCAQVAEIKREIKELRQEYKADFAGLERNLAEDIRGVHERLDRVIEGKR